MGARGVPQHTMGSHGGIPRNPEVPRDIPRQLPHASTVVATEVLMETHAIPRHPATNENSHCPQLPTTCHDLFHEFPSYRMSCGFV